VDKKKLQEAEWRDGHYLLRSNLTAGDPSVLWMRYVQLTQIESVFRSLKSELGIRPIYHQLEHRVDAHILIAFLAYCLQVTLKQRLLLHAPGLTPTAVLEKLADIQMIDVWIPTVDQRWLILPRYTQPSLDTKLLIEKLKLQLPSQPPPRLIAQKQIMKSRYRPSGRRIVCGEDLTLASTDSKALNRLRGAQLRKFG
jgi:Transposase DDE domain